MFRDFKSGGYNLENCRLTGQRFLAIVLLIAIAYTLATDQGKNMRSQHVPQYVGRVKEPGRSQKRHRDFWFGLYGQLWVDSIHQWSNWAHPLMRLKPQKRIFFWHCIMRI